MPTLWCIQVNMKFSIILQMFSSTYPIVITSLYRKKRRNRRSCSHLNGTNYQRLDESKDQKTECAGGHQAQGPCFPWTPDPRLPGVGKPPWGNCEKGSEVHRKAKPSVWLSLQVREHSDLYFLFLRSGQTASPSATWYSSTSHTQLRLLKQ